MPKAPKSVLHALIEVKVRPQKARGYHMMAQRIAKHHQVQNVYLMSGVYDLLISVEGETLEEISNFVSDKLAPIEHVQSTITHFVLKKYKENGKLLTSDDELERLAVSL
jgi:DNA-binding Lrp family transcriptional regulator